MAVLVTLGDTLGAGLFTAVFSAMIYGANLRQMTTYYSEYASNDGPALKLFVAVLLVIDTISVAFTSHVEYVVCVTNFGDLSSLLHPPCLGLQALCDVLITAGMVFYILSHRGPIKQTNAALNVLAFYSFNCGVLNIMCTLGCLISYIARPIALTWAVFVALQTKLGVCAFMALLNSRQRIRAILETPSDMTLVLPGVAHV
ncbi:hypothetical protein BC834DRAFT_975416 [Gloeopeniophorella convolvens]|nr:hypothetical protein BC834DRAFT_975416 [Gloeopeniophorella convolvens]